MSIHTALFPRATAAILAALVLAAAAAPARADNFRHGPRHGAWTYHHDYRHRPFARPYRGGPRFVFRSSVVVVPQPQVVYVPAPYPVAPVAAVPASPVYQAADGRYCREYQATVTVNGVPQESYGTACMEPDGTWRIAN